jgi:hypothetical protein
VQMIFWRGPREPASWWQSGQFSELGSYIAFPVVLASNLFIVVAPCWGIPCTPFTHGLVIYGAIAMWLTLLFLCMWLVEDVWRTKFGA